MRHIRITVQHLVLMAALSGCAVGPDYRVPEIPAPQAWHTGLGGGLSNAPLDTAQLANWWDTLNDPLLSRFIQTATANNLDLKQAQARLREARARRSASVAERFPTLAVKDKKERIKDKDKG